MNKKELFRLNSVDFRVLNDNNDFYDKSDISFQEVV